MQGIRRWLAAHPGEEPGVLNANPRFIFFRPLLGPAVGSLAVPVTAGRTIATDPAIYPPGALAYVRIPPDEATGPSHNRGLERVVLNQDRGAAIRGPGRADVFFGSGTEAEETAGRTKARGELYFLAPR
jgi:membrane-bound lytic murein transglycosylase A